MNGGRTLEHQGKTCTSSNPNTEQPGGEWRTLVLRVDGADRCTCWALKASQTPQQVSTPCSHVDATQRSSNYFCLTELKKHDSVKVLLSRSSADSWSFSSF